MEGITYIVNETENKRYVQIDLALYQEEWEDFYDSLIVKARKKNGKAKISFAEMVEHLKANDEIDQDYSPQKSKQKADLTH